MLFVDNVLLNSNVHLVEVSDGLEEGSAPEGYNCKYFTQFLNIFHRFTQQSKYEIFINL